VKRVKVIASDEFQIHGQFMTALGRELPSRLRVHRRQQKKLDVIAQIDLETYLVGVLSSEMPTSWPLEALKAQAVAARSYTLAVLAERKSQYFDLESSVMDQVFKYPRNLSTEARQKVQIAVQQTKGVILKEESGRPLKAFYHADCGGQTKSPRQVWGQGAEDWQTTQDHSCPLSPKAKWTLRLSSQSLQKKLGLKESEIIQIRGPFRENGKDYVHLWTSQKRKISWLANDFRSKLGFDQLKSTNFRVLKKNGNFIFEGQGHGHGVGLCQWGSRVQAERGQTYQQILSHYYKSARLMYTVSQNDKQSF
jgi:stage II sporulation protein D